MINLHLRKPPLELLIQRINTPASIQVTKDAPLLLYGAGNFGKKVAKNLISQGYKVLGFLDLQAKPMLAIDDVPVFYPFDPGLFSKEKKGITVLLTLHNRDVDLTPVIQKLNKAGFTKIYSPVEYFKILQPGIDNVYWLTSPKDYSKWEDAIVKTFSLMDDESSRALFSAIIGQRVGGDYSILPKPDLTHQYYPQDIPNWKYPLRFVDCGAYDGDTLRQMKRDNLQFEDIIAFEPDEIHFGKLAKYLSDELDTAALAYPYGVSSSTGNLRFKSDGGEGGKFAEGGTSTIKVVTLDEVMTNFHPNLIKMDIEGAEIEAIQGAKKIISSDRPGLAICVYHLPQHLWQILETINQWNLGYKFFLRTHGYNGFETVLYAIHPET